MPHKSSSGKYGTVAVTIHCLSALLIFALIGSVFRAEGMKDLAAKTDILKIHVSFGIVILLLTLTRIIWWKFVDKKPDSAPMPKLQDRVARAVHVLFYVVILGMPTSGIGMMILSGAGLIIFGTSVEKLPNFLDYKPHTPHEVGAKLMFVLLIVHAGAALYHHFVKKDGLLRRMW